MGDGRRRFQSLGEEREVELDVPDGGYGTSLFEDLGFVR
jgi:hypothetical protein